MSRDRSMSPKHKHSFSDLSKLTVPMWDSSDPDRAPPPLPLNPQNPNASPTKPNTSENVAAAARALAERARENSGPSPYTTNPMHDRSPDRSPTRTPQHKRLQSLQHGNLKDFKASLENGRGMEWHNPRPSTPATTKDVFSSSPERSQSRTGSPNAFDGRDINKDTSSGRRSSRPGPRPILGENTPPSATMLAIQNMAHRDVDTPLDNIVNSSAARSPRNTDSILSQMQNLTSIATTLQKEMAALSRRSKDNATDLVSLKEATKTRDEDIRKSLRELVTSARASDLASLAPPRGDMSRSTSAMDFVPRFLETKVYHSPPFAKSVSLPRIPPIHGAENGSDLDRATSPAPYSVEGAASIAMLEKIIREMGTKEGQDRLLSTLSELMDKASKDSSNTAKKVEDLADVMKETKNSRALVKHMRGDNVFEVHDADTHGDNDDSVQDASRSRPRPQTTNFVSDELRQVLQRIKDSVAQSGGMTGEVKSLVRELRGEVLGMGRELGRKLDETGQPQNERALVLAESQATKDDIGRIIQEGLNELKEHMDQMIQLKRRQSSSSALSRHSVDSAEVSALVKQSLAEHALERPTGLTPQAQCFDQEAIINAVKEAYEAYKPEIELQQFGLERDEILLCLREGLDDYQSTKSTSAGISRDEIVEAVQEALQHFTPPAPVTEASEIKEEVLEAVRECLGNFQPPNQQRSEWKSGDITKDDILSTVREGLGNFKKEGAREIEISREDLFQAVKAGLDNTQTPFGGYGDEVLKSLHDIVEGMRVEFKEYSAANGRDTELVLDTTKDGLESLRVEIESYVDRCRDVTGKDEIIETLKDGIGNLQTTVATFASESSRGDSVSSRSEIVNYIRSQFEQLQEAIVAQERRNDHTVRTHEQLLETFTSGLSELKSATQQSRGFDGPTDDVLDAMKEEFEQLREAVLDGSASHRNELLKAIQDNVANLGDISGGRGIVSDTNEGLISVVREEFATLRENLSAPVLHRGIIEDNDGVLATIKQSIEGLRVQLSADHTDITDQTLDRIKDEFERIRETISSGLIPGALSGGNTEISEAIRDGLENLKDMDGRTAGSEPTGPLESIRQELELLRQSMARTMVQSGNSADVEDIATAIRTGFDDLQRIPTTLDTTSRSAEESEGILSAFQEGLTELRADIARMADKPVDLDMTVSYDILDTLKEGLASLRSDMERVMAGGQTLANGDVVLSNGNGATESLSKSDFEKLELMLTRLQIKVEAMDQNSQSSQSAQSAAHIDSTTREALTGIETMIYELRGTIDILVSQKSSGVSKDDTDALETLLLNTKAKIDEHILPSLDASVTKDHLDAVEAVVRLTGESVEGLATRLEGDLASKDDVAAVYQLLENADSSIKAFKDHFDHETAEKPSKDDVEAIERICDEIKDKVDSLPPSDIVPTKEDLEQLTDLVEKFKTSHERFRSQYEADLEITAKAFDDRKEESEKIIEHITDLKSFVAESKDEIKSRLKRGNEDVRALDEILQGIEDKIDESPNAISDVQEVLEVVNREFERSHVTLDNLQSSHDERSATLLEKHESLHTLITEELAKKLDNRFSEVLARHDEQQQAVEAAAHVVAGKAAQQDELLMESRAMAEDLRLTIDTLGESVTAINPALREATEKMGDDAKTVFNKVEDLHSRMDANHVDAMGENQLVRQDISKSLSSIGVLHDAIMNFQPQAMATLSNLLAIAGEHYEHSKRSSSVTQDQSEKSSIEETIRSSFAALPLPRIEAPPASSMTAHDDTKLHTKLDEILASSKKDDSKVHSKLDLISNAVASKEHLPVLSKIDEMHGQLQTTATEVSDFMAFHTSIVKQEHQIAKNEARQAADDLARYRSDKDDLEIKIANLAATRQSLAADVESLMADRDALTTQKSRLAAEVSSLETALNIRREELQDMDTRAENLERRIIEGVMDHSRALLIAKQPKGSANMNLKRVTSNASNATTSTTTPSSVANAGMNLALSKKRSNKQNSASSNPAARRILSLNQITGNAPKGSGVSASRPILGGLNNLKRSQSVKNPRISWAGQGSIVEFDKENDSLKEESDEDSETDGGYNGTATSMTNRSDSVNGSRRTASERQMSLGTGPSEYSYGTDSYLTGPDSLRTTSYGSTIRSVIGGGSSIDESIVEDDEQETEMREVDCGEIDEKGETEETIGDLMGEATEEVVGDLDYEVPVDRHKDLVIRPPDGYDSGLGSDLPTALAMSQNGSDYFESFIKGQGPC